MYHPKIFRVAYEDTTYHRRDTYGGMDSEPSHQTRDPKEEFIIAPDMETAQFLWAHRSRAITSRTDIQWTEIGNVSLMIAGAYGL
jgi:hypothetical protein